MTDAHRAHSPGTAGPPSVAWIIPVHNRREITLSCLRRLHRDGVLKWSEVYIVDDGSIDGTAEAVAIEFPHAHVVRGSGDLWWTGSTALGMRAAMAGGAEILCWLNDDTEPLPGACAHLVACVKETGAVVTGQCLMSPQGPVVYGGLLCRGVVLQLVPVSGAEPIDVDATCGNFVGLPRAVITAIGYPDAARFPHAFGDQDFTLRARRAGFRVVIDPLAAADARPNALANYASWLLSDISVTAIWRQLFDRRSYAYAPAHAMFLTRHFGAKGAAYWVWTVVKRVPISLVRLLVPQRWLRRWWGPRSRAWQTERSVRAALAESGRVQSLK